MNDNQHTNDENERDDEFGRQGSEGTLDNVIPIKGMYNDWFLDYASYVILERAVPHLNDGLKPVQRRILHSLREMDDGRFHKVANAIGNTMKYHPHGDASIGDAMVQVGQKELMLDMQGNWGNVATGDRAAAPRYIEVKLSKFALEVAFNAKTTTWLSSYDSRNKEPETLPMKFPLLLAQGVEGIAVGLACKMLPHNFVELIDASVLILKDKKATIVPDFQSGGMADVSNYNDGLRGGKIRVRAKMRKEDDRTLEITEIPYGTTTSSVIDSVLKANDKGKIKIRKIEDNTAEHVSIVIHLPKGVSPDKTIDALYAFSDCEVSISPNACVIFDDKPHFMGISEMLRNSTIQTKDLLRRELEIEKSELEEQWHFASLEKIFIENRIYRDIEECETWDAILTTIHEGLKPFTKHLLREVTDEDVTRLTEIRIKRISKFDSFKADERLTTLEEGIARVKHHLDNLTEFAIAYFLELKRKYGAGRERKTELRTFDRVDAAKVAVSNAKLYVNREEGFVGTGLKRGEGDFVCDCSDIDDLIVFRKDGKMIVSRVSQKAFVGKDILHVGIWKKGDTRTVYNLIYQDGKGGRGMWKRFSVTSITRDKEYDLTKGTAGSVVLYFTANPNGEAEVVSVHLKALQRLKKLRFDADFSELAIKGRGAGGNVLSKNPIRKVELKERGVSTLGARKIWYDETVSRLNTEDRGRYLGAFAPDDRILVVLSSGEYQLVGFDLSTHFDEKMIHLEKWVPQRPMSCVYLDAAKETWFVKRFFIESSSKLVRFIGDEEENKLGLATTLNFPQARVRYNKKFKATRSRPDEVVDIWDFISVKGIKAQGNRLNTLPVTEVLLEPANEEKEQEANAAYMPAPAPVETPEAAEAPAANEQPAPELAQPTSAPQKVVAPKPIQAVKDEVSKPIDLNVASDTSEDGDEEAPQLGLF